MKATVRTFSVLAVVVIALAAFTQSKPNFAGTWTQVVDPNAAAGGGRGRGGFGLGQQFTAAQDEKTLTVTTTNAQIGEIKTVYNLDGSEAKNPMSFGGQTVDRVTKAKWDGTKLVLTSTLTFNGNPAETTQAWSLDASGQLAVEQTSNFTGTPQTTKTTYKKGS